MSIQQKQHIQNLIETEAKMSLENFFKNIHQKFYSDYDISFMQYFLELTTREGEFACEWHSQIGHG